VELDTGEELITAAIGPGSPLTKAALALEPFIVPYDQLARVDGWVLWFGHPPVPEDVPLLPAPDHLLWGEPLGALATATAVAADYAARRGARSDTEARAVLGRESPVAVVVPGDLTGSLAEALVEARNLGLPIVDRPAGPVAAIADVPSFARRRSAHAQPVGRPHDPALTFQEFVVEDWVGRDVLSSFFLHHEAVRDGVSVVGELDDRVGIEIGVRAAGVGIEATERLEREAALIPSYLSGVASRFEGGSLEIGWRRDARPTADEVGAVLHVWLKALFGFDLVDVRLAFAPSRGRSARLAEMRTRARAYKQERDRAIAGDSTLLRAGDGADARS
jgi:hypothetical protein